MDYALAAAAARGVHLIISLEDYWLSIDRYVEWSPTAGGRTDFYTDWFCRNTYRDHVRTFLNRRNTITGVRYKDDPTAGTSTDSPTCEAAALTRLFRASRNQLFDHRVPGTHNLMSDRVRHVYTTVDP